MFFFIVGYQDIILKEFSLPSAIQVPSKVKVRLQVEISLGSLAYPINAGDFVSSLYLSKDDKLDPGKDLKWVELSNDAGKLALAP